MKLFNCKSNLKKDIIKVSNNSNKLSMISFIKKYPMNGMKNTKKAFINLI